MMKSISKLFVIKQLIKQKARKQIHSSLVFLKAMMSIAIVAIVLLISLSSTISALSNQNYFPQPPLSQQQQHQRQMVRNSGNFRFQAPLSEQMTPSQRKALEQLVRTKYQNSNTNNIHHHQMNHRHYTNNQQQQQQQQPRARQMHFVPNRPNQVHTSGPPLPADRRTSGQQAGDHSTVQSSGEESNGKKLLICYYTTRQQAPYWPKDAREYIIPPEGSTFITPDSSLLVTTPNPSGQHPQDQQQTGSSFAPIMMHYEPFVGGEARSLVSSNPMQIGEQSLPFANLQQPIDFVQVDSYQQHGPQQYNSGQTLKSQPQALKLQTTKQQLIFKSSQSQSPQSSAQSQSITDSNSNSANQKHNRISKQKQQDGTIVQFVSPQSEQNMSIRQPQFYSSAFSTMQTSSSTTNNPLSGTVAIVGGKPVTPIYSLISSLDSEVGANFSPQFQPQTIANNGGQINNHIILASSGHNQSLIKQQQQQVDYNGAGNNANYPLVAERISTSSSTVADSNILPRPSSAKLQQAQHQHQQLKPQVVSNSKSAQQLVFPSTSSAQTSLSTRVSYIPSNLIGDSQQQQQSTTTTTATTSSLSKPPAPSMMLAANTKSGDVSAIMMMMAGDTKSHLLVPAGNSQQKQQQHSNNYHHNNNQLKAAASSNQALDSQSSLYQNQRLDLVGPSQASSLQQLSAAEQDELLQLAGQSSQQSHQTQLDSFAAAAAAQFHDSTKLTSLPADQRSPTPTMSGSTVAGNDNANNLIIMATTNKPANSQLFIHSHPTTSTSSSTSPLSSISSSTESSLGGKSVTQSVTALDVSATANSPTVLQTSQHHHSPSTGSSAAPGSSTSKSSYASQFSQQQQQKQQTTANGLTSASSSPLSTMFDVFGAASQYLMRFKPSSLISPSSFASFNNLQQSNDHHQHQLNLAQQRLPQIGQNVSLFGQEQKLQNANKGSNSIGSGILARFNSGSAQGTGQRREDVCGRTIQTPERRIIGGEGARYGEFPYQVHIKIAKHQCGGALVDRQSIVTAAHCVYHFITRAPVSKLQIVIGAYDIEDEQYQELPPQYFKVNKVKLHPNFRFSASHPDRYDIAILKLDKPVKYTDNVLPVCLPSKDLKFEHMIGTVTGFGKTDPSLSNRYGTRLLQKVDVPIIENNECERWHRTRGIDLKIFPEMMCAGYEDGLKDACVGDSGGPLVVKTAAGPNGAFRWTLAGITSAGFGCAQSRQPGIYHRLSHTVDWILENLD